jgi:hypothetical protein
LGSELAAKKNSGGRETTTNGGSPILETVHAWPHDTFERFGHSKKQRQPIMSTDEGMQMDCSDEQFENADSPSVES